ncbi:ABC transporter ATP-binding protein [Aliarcobacter butzleri]|uniref:ABC transporter ATP-binding protein n=1 Tax=Aliarcobacter butzleri TaxID=28197 RepID=UPI001EDD5106|nr:ABC transporter ATP-binding protein [Aliarcobacter butzleri]MCG3674637.1 ABC transporter ATP-binding protein/permease [Aliarcobacter butzleri]
MIKTYKKIWLLFDNKERRKAIYLLLLMVFMAFFEVLGIGSIMPFLAVLGDPQKVYTNEYLYRIFQWGEFSNTNSYLIFLGIFAFIMLLLSALLGSFAQYAQFHFTNLRRHSIARKLLVRYIHQPYSFFLMRNSSDISKTILSETDLLIGQVIMPAFKILAYGVIGIVLMFFLLLVDFRLAMILSIVFGGFYIIMYLSVRKFLSKLSVERSNANTQRFKITAETIGGIKDLKLLGREKVYLKSFETPSFNFSKYAAISQTISMIPNFMVEVLAFGAILAVAIYGLSNEEANLGNLLPILGLYSLGALKLKPAFSNIYSSISTMKFGNSSLDNILEDLQKEELIEIKPDVKTMFLKKSLELKNINFYYHNCSKPSLININFKIKANTTVGIIGKTGAGKSTLIDLMLGLLSPSSGEIKIDDTVLNNENIRMWQNSIGYVSQNIFLADDTIASNIAFGIEKNNIDFEQVKKVSEMAQIHDFIESLDDKYETLIGENGVRLSGGQRQRLGIARALYHNPNILFLDEATSALDNETEKEVMNAINKLNGQKTIVMIAHRLSTIENCDVVIKLKNGVIVNNENN